MNTGATQGWASPAFRSDPGFKLESLSLPLDILSGRIAGTGQLLMQRLTEFRHIALWIQVCRAESVGEVKRGLGGRPPDRSSASGGWVGSSTIMTVVLSLSRARP